MVAKIRAIALRNLEYREVLVQRPPEPGRILDLSFQGGVRHVAPVGRDAAVNRLHSVEVDRVIDRKQIATESSVAIRQQIDDRTLHRIHQAVDGHEDVLGLGRKPCREPSKGPNTDDDVLGPSDGLEIRDDVLGIEEQGLWKPFPYAVGIRVRGGLPHEHRLQPGFRDRIGVEFDGGQRVVGRGVVQDLSRSDVADQILAPEAHLQARRRDEHVKVVFAREEIFHPLGRSRRCMAGAGRDCQYGVPPPPEC